jgi:hypothetical protein
MLKVLSVLGAGTLAISTLWGFLFIAAPSLPTQPPADKIGPALTIRDSKPRGVVEQPRTTATVPETRRVTTVKLAPQPEPMPPVVATPAVKLAPQPEPMPPVVATPAVMVSPTPPGGTENPQEPEAMQVALDRGNDLVGAAKPRLMPSVRQDRAPRCTRNRSYNAATRSYRGFDGVVHRCRS